MTQSLYTITYRDANPYEDCLTEFICTIDSLNNITWILDNANDVIDYQISAAGGIVHEKLPTGVSRKKLVTKFIWETNNG
jgi:hypothetical protein